MSYTATPIETTGEIGEWSLSDHDGIRMALHHRHGMVSYFLGSADQFCPTCGYTTLGKTGQGVATCATVQPVSDGTSVPDVPVQRGT
jgi:hypothetical protein